jgi:hypothetical protein
MIVPKVFRKPVIHRARPVSSGGWPTCDARSGGPVVRLQGCRVIDQFAYASAGRSQILARAESTGHSRTSPGTPARSRVVQGGQRTHRKTSCSCALVLAWLEACRMTIDFETIAADAKACGLQPTLPGRFVRVGGGRLVAVRPGADVPGDLGAHRVVGACW